jgi:thiosulfate dehydrogenase
VKGFFLGVITTVLLLAAGGFAYLWSGLAEVRSDEPRSALENYLLQTAVHASIRRNAPELHSPVPPTDVNLITGGRMYLEQCAGCHGTPGKPRKYPVGLNPTAAQFVTVGTQYTESQVFWVAKHGIRWTGMAANGLWEDDEELWALAGYVKRMDRLPQHVKDELAKASGSAGH